MDDLIIKNVRVVRPQGHAVHEADIAVRDGKFAAVAGGLDAKQAKRVVRALRGSGARVLEGPPTNGNTRAMDAAIEEGRARRASRGHLQASGCNKVAVGLDKVKVKLL